VHGPSCILGGDALWMGLVPSGRKSITTKDDRPHKISGWQRAARSSPGCVSLPPGDAGFAESTLMFAFSPLLPGIGQPLPG